MPYDKVIHPELGETVEADNQIEYSCSYNSKFYLTTDLNLKGQGIKLSGDGSDHKRKMKAYSATEKAMYKLKAKYNCTYIGLL